MSNNTILATISNKSGYNVEEVTVKDYTKMLTDKNQKEIAEMIYHRFYGRYIKPFLFNDDRYKEHYKQGFAMMASACLLIEALESFYQGLDRTPDRKNEQAFKSFFERESDFKKAKFNANEFYRHVRCGILHQAETTDEYIISREGHLLDRKTINAHKFLISLEKSLVAYKKRLLNEAWDSEIWDNLRRKMRFIISHC
jgi:hypothetical protein